MLAATACAATRSSAARLAETPSTAITLSGPRARAADERVAAHAVAASIGVDVVEVQTHEGDRAEYRRNDVDRCFHCKDELFTRISQQVVVAHGLTAVAYGENADDARRPDRPGSRAATMHAVLRPLADAGMDKAAVRRIARALDLPSADKPAAPCLASRIPHHFEVTPEKLAQVERPGDAPYGRLVHSRVGQRSQDRVHGGRPRPGTVGAPRIIGVLAIGHGGQPMGDHDLLRDPGEE